MPAPKITHFTVNIGTIPPKGFAKVLVDMSHEDRIMLNRAAHEAGLPMAQFARAVLLSAAEKVLRELGVRG